METRSFRNIPVSVLTFGSMAISDLYNPDADLSEARAALELALDAGVNTIHTAHHYGDGSAFRVIRKVLSRRELGQEIQIIAKIDGHAARMRGAKEGIDPTRHALDRDYIDFVQLVESSPDYGNPVTPADIILDLRKQGATYEAVSLLKDRGLARQIGVEAYTHVQLRQCLECPGLDFVVLDQSIIRQTAFEPDVVAALIAEEIGVFAIRPLAGGWLTDSYRTAGDFGPRDRRREWYWRGELYRAAVADYCCSASLDITEAALRFLLGQQQIGSVVLGMRTVNQVRKALAALEKGPLPDVDQATLESLFEQPVVLEPD